MPSPVAHSLAGLAVAGLARYYRAGRCAPWPASTGHQDAWRTPVLIVALVCAANAPDLDFVPGVLAGHPDWLHRGISHSFVAAIFFGTCAGVVARLARLNGSGLFGGQMAAAYATHLLLDMFSPDPLRFNGVPLLWPLSERHVILPAQVFLDIRRDQAAGGFLASLWHLHNVHAVVREILIIAPILVAGRLAGTLLAARRAGRTVTAVARLDRRVNLKS